MSEPIPKNAMNLTFTIGEKTITIAVGNNVGLDEYILPLEGFKPEWQAVLLGENYLPLTVILDSYDDTDIFTARNASGEHVFFRIVGSPLKGNSRLQRVDPAEILLSKDYYRGKGDDTAAKGGNAAEAPP